jgi:hypothetical protein
MQLVPLHHGEDVAKIRMGQEPERFAKVIRDFGALIDKARKDRGKVKAASSNTPDVKDAGKSKTDGGKAAAKGGGKYSRGGALHVGIKLTHNP